MERFLTQRKDGRYDSKVWSFRGTHDFVEVPLEDLIPFPQAFMQSSVVFKQT